MATSETYAIQTLDVYKAISVVNNHMKHLDEQESETSPTTQTHRSIIDEEG
jgi:hypothetical protein